MMAVLPNKSWNWGLFSPRGLRAANPYKANRYRLAIILLLLFPFLSWAQPSPQSKKVTEKFFPDVEIEFPTPAFQKKKGFTDYDEMMAFLQSRLDAHPDKVKLSYIGTSQKGKAIPLLRFSPAKGPAETIKVWIQAGLHGDEPASSEGILYLVDQLLNEPKYAPLLESLDLAIVPMANIDGYEKQDRYAANGLDLNRDQTKLAAIESIALKQAFSNFQAEVALDFHEYRPYRKDFAQLSTYGITSRFDAMFLYSGNLNVPKNLRSFTESVFVANAREAMDEQGLRHHDYVSTTRHRGEIHFTQGSLNARSSATSFALAQTVSCLFEIRGVGIGRTSFSRRVYTTFLLATSFLQTAVDQREQVKTELQLARTYQEAAVVTSKAHVSEAGMPVIDLDTNEEIVLPVTVRDAWKATPVLTRSRPFAYLVLPEQTNLLEKLSTLALEMDSLAASTEVEVEAYRVTEYQQDPEKYEGVSQQTVVTEIQTLRRSFPVGTRILYLDQPRAGLAIEVLEPEAPNSFVSFAVLPTEEGAELPVYRYLISQRL